MMGLLRVIELPELVTISPWIETVLPPPPLICVKEPRILRSAVTSSAAPEVSVIVKIPALVI
jgi:hypothetical protein